MKIKVTKLFVVIAELEKLQQKTIYHLKQFLQRQDQMI